MNETKARTHRRVPSDDVTTTSVVCRCVNHYVLPAVTTRRRYRIIVCVRYRYFLNKVQFIFSGRLIFTRRFYMHRRYLRASKSHSPLRVPSSHCRASQFDRISMIRIIQATLSVPTVLVVSEYLSILQTDLSLLLQSAILRWHVLITTIIIDPSKDFIVVFH